MAESKVSNMMIKSKTILVVEDNNINRGLLYEYLSKDYNVILAADGLQAIDIIEERKEEISLMLLDIVMPEFNGFEVLEEPNASGWIEFLPVVIISSEGSEEFKHRAYLNNVYNFITKPFTHEEVMSCVKRILSESDYQ